MALDWDILLDGVSIKDQIQEFQIRRAKYTFVDELTLNSVSPDFFDSIDYTKIPELRVQVKIKLESDWISLGYFYIEKPIYSVSPNQKISSGVWGRSQTAKAGEPFAKKITYSWTDSTTMQSIMNEVALIAGLDIVFEINDYPIYAGSYAVDLKYPIEIIQELCEFCGAFVSCNTDGALVIKKEIFHATSEDYEIDDTYIREVSENVTFPQFGNRIKVSSFSGNSGYSITLTTLEDSSCLPADGDSQLTLLAFVTLDGEPVEDNVLVSWSTEDGVTLEKDKSSTGSYLVDHQQHKATNFHQVTVDYPIQSIVGIWAYADTSHQHNFWDPSRSGFTFEDKTITIPDSFTYCDQTLVITYITSGCAVNKVTAGEEAIDVDVTANIEGASSSLEIKLGNTCACGTTLNAKAASSDPICFDHCGSILAWATINNKPALGYTVYFKREGYGILKGGFSKVLGYVNVYAEICTVFNVISGVSQVKTSMPISESHPAPRVYRKSSTGANRYSSHDGQTIDLNYRYETGVELLVYYTAAGAALNTWCVTTAGLDDDVEATGSAGAEITVSLASGSEVKSKVTVSMSAIDCTVVTAVTPPIPDWPEPDPLPTPDPEPSPYFPIEPTGGYPVGDDGNPSDPYPDGDPDPGDGLFPGESDGDLSPDIGSAEGDDSGDVSEDGSEPGSGSAPTVPEDKLPDPEGESGGVVGACDIAILNKISNYENLVEEDAKSALRFGVTNPDECQEPPCTCEEMCESEVYEKGNTYDNYQTINEQTLEQFEAGTPEYTELFEQIKTENIATCASVCEDARSNLCNPCEVTTTAVLSPGESIEVVCSDGTTEIITMPEDACGTVSFTVGCCTFDIRSTVGTWVRTTEEYADWPENPRCGLCDVNYHTCSVTNQINDGDPGHRYSGASYCVTNFWPDGCNPWIPVSTSLCDPCGTCQVDGTPGTVHPYSYLVDTWQCS